MWFNAAGQGILKKRPPARFPDAYLTKCKHCWQMHCFLRICHNHRQPVECLQCRTAAGKVWFVLEKQSFVSYKETKLKGRYTANL